MQLHQLARTHTNKTGIDVGRGGKRGKTSGRGTKGQNARSGHKKRPELRDIIKKIPKLRGYHFNSIQEKPVAVPLRTIGRRMAAGAAVNPKTLVEQGIIATLSGALPKVKLIGNEISIAITVTGCTVSAGAKKAIEAAKGSVA